MVSGYRMRRIRIVSIYALLALSATMSLRASGVYAQKTLGEDEFHTLTADRPDAHSVRDDELFDILMSVGDSAFAAFNNELASAYFLEAAKLDTSAFVPVAKALRALTTEAKDLIDEGHKDEARRLVDTSIVLAEQLASRHPDEAESYLQLAAAHGNHALISGGKTKVRIGGKIEEYCKKAIELDADFAPPYLVLGIMYRKLDELSWIERTFANALLGNLPKGSKDLSEHYIELALERDPGIVVGWYELGLTRLAMKDEIGAVAAFNSAIERPPQTSADVKAREQAAIHLRELD